MKLSKMVAHRGFCENCKENYVMMLREPKTLKLLPHMCFCINCGQKYFMEIEDIDAWEIQQWEQKQSSL